MKKKKQLQHKPKQNKEDSPLTLGDMINQDLFQKLKETQQELKAEETRRIEEEEQRKKEERRLKEKNKSFEELLNDSEMSWKDFK